MNLSGLLLAKNTFILALKKRLAGAGLGVQEITCKNTQNLNTRKDLLWAPLHDLHLSALADASALNSLAVKFAGNESFAGIVF